MKLRIIKIIGRRNYSFEVEGNNLFDLVMESQKLGFNDVYTCGLCKSEKLFLRAYVTEKGNFDYVKVQCADCKGSITFGKTKKDKDTYFLRKNDDGTLAWEAPLGKNGQVDEPEEA